MKKLFLFAMTGFFFAANANAQVTGNNNPAQKVQSDSLHRHHRGKMGDQLNLTADQKTKMQALRENNKQQRDAIKNDASLSQEQKTTKMKVLRKSQSDQMNSFLTPDQQAKRNAYIQKMKANHKMHGKRNWNNYKKSDSTNVK